MKRKNVLIMGAAGRDFHNFNLFFRDNPRYNVVAFTAAQIPAISDRKYPPELAGKLYKKGIPIYSEEKLTDLIKKFKINIVYFSYSDVSYSYVMHRASKVLAAGANFKFIGLNDSQLKSKKPVISVCAVRTGCGKSPTTRYIAKLLKNRGKKIVVVRHPMPYGNLLRQVCQRYGKYEDLEKNNCTIEEREEFEPYIEKGIPIYAGVDYKKILRQAEREADVILWDGGNNDFPFYKPNIQIVLVDAQRPGHEISYYPGEVNFRLADVLIISKYKDAPKKNLEIIKKNIKLYNPNAIVLKTELKIVVDHPKLIRNKNVLVVEDGPTITHGGLCCGAGYHAAKKYGAKIINPKRSAVGSINEVYKKYPHIKNVLPAMGYSEKQVKELEQTINKSSAETVVIATPIDLARFIKINKYHTRVRYYFSDPSKRLRDLIDRFCKGKKVC